MTFQLLVLYIFALYGLLIFFRKIFYNPSKDDSRVKKGDSLRFYIEPYRRYGCNCSACDRGDWSNCSVACENACG